MQSPEMRPASANSLGQNYSRISVSVLNPFCHLAARVAVLLLRQQQTGPASALGDLGSLVFAKCSSSSVWARR